MVVVVIFLFIGLAFAPPINANMGKLNKDISQENDTILVELEYQRIIEKVKTINLKKFLFDIDGMVNTLEEISIILEKNDDLRAYIEMQSDYCGCSDGTTEWSFPVLCILLIPIWYVSFFLFYNLEIELTFYIIMIIGGLLNCPWGL